MFFIKKSSKITILLLLFLITLACTSKKASKSPASLSFHITGSKKTFIFTVSEDFLSQNKSSAVHKKHTKLTNAEFDLLLSLLKEKKYCLDNKNKYAFSIDSRQEKIFDVTYSQLIAKSYNAKPISPVSYYGSCI
jgi:hypothetical protein